MRHARRLAIVEIGAFAVPFLVAVPLHWMSSDAQNIFYVTWMVFTICAAIVAAHAAGLFGVLLAPVTVIVSVVGVYLGGYAPYGLHIGSLESSDYGCCDLGTGAEGVWNRIKMLSFFGTFLGGFIGVIVWLIEGLPAVARYVEGATTVGRRNGTFRR